MKNFIIALMILFTSAGSYAQTLYKASYRAQYSLIYTRDSTTKFNLNSEDMYLQIGEEGSRFFSKNSIYRDSIKLLMKENFAKTGILAVPKDVPKTKFNYSIYKDYKTKEIRFYDKIAGGDKYLVKENSKEFDWIIKPENKVINGYSCQMATVYYAGRDYVAWFTTEIPFQDGPYKFSGLPGLIVSVHDIKDQYRFELISFIELENIENINLPKFSSLYKTIKREDFAEANITAVKRIGAIYASQNTDEEEVASLKQKLKKNNNPIELK